MAAPVIVPFDPAAHREQVVALWREVFNYGKPHTEPGLVIDKKTAFDDLFFVAVDPSRVIGTIMAGYDGHRGWIYSLAVAPDRRREGIGSALLRFAEERLAATGCMKINLQVVAGNELVEGFYHIHGYTTERRIDMGKVIERNVPAPQGMPAETPKGATESAI
jgi:ribosomal protein S18 acetylase RimI-like enzyme